MKKGIVNFLGAIAGKEVSKELISEFQDEFDDIIQILKSSTGIENIPNLEIETYEISVSSANELVDVVSKTKIEHKRILGVFTSYRDSDINYGSKVSIQIDRQFIVADGKFHFFFLEKKEGQSIYEASFRTDVKIDTSDVEIKYQDGGHVPTPYKAYVNFICQKR